MIRDDKLIPVQNLTASTVSYIIPETNNVRRFSGQQLRKDITAGELRSLYGTKGGRTLIEDYLGIRDKELATEFNISTDVFEHEYSWTQNEVDNVLTSGSLDALKDALEFGFEWLPPSPRKEAGRPKEKEQQKKIYIVRTKPGRPF